MLRHLPKVAIGFAVPIDYHIPVGIALLVATSVPAMTQLSQSVSVRGVVQQRLASIMQRSNDATAIGIARATTCVLTAENTRIEAGAAATFKTKSGVKTPVPDGTSLCDVYAGFTAEVKGGLIVDVQPIEINQLRSAINSRAANQTNNR